MARSSTWLGSASRVLRERTGRRASILDVNDVDRASLLVARARSPTVIALFPSVLQASTSMPRSTPAPSATPASTNPRSSKPSAARALRTPQQRGLAPCPRTSAPTDAGSGKASSSSATGTPSASSIRPTIRKLLLNAIYCHLTLLAMNESVEE